METYTHATSRSGFVKILLAVLTYATVRCGRSFDFFCPYLELSQVYTDFKDSLIKNLQDPKLAEEYLAVALESYSQDQDKDAFLLALRDVAEAQGGLTQLAMRTDLNRQNLYRALSNKGNPRLETIGIVLQELGFRFNIERIKSALGG